MTRARARPRVLHVAALPFPSTQGTQAAIASMLEHSVCAGRDAQLFTYATDTGAAITSYALHRTGRFPRVASLRSGPSIAKVLLDARMLVELRALERRLRPEVIVAHHVEAAMQALAVAHAPVVFFAHTDLAVELPTYAPSAASAVLARAGRALDALLVRRAEAVAVIAPSLQARMSALASTATNAATNKVFYVPTPWRIAPEITREERCKSRAALGLREQARVLLYAGNLDRYQGLDLVLDAVQQLAARDPRLILLVATESCSRPLRAQARERGVVERLHVTPLLGEAARRLAHAAADVAVVPRLSPGGLPIKLLDALARGVACVTVPRACAGLAIGDAVHVAGRDDDAGALASALAWVLDSPARRAQLSQDGPRYVAFAHGAAPFLHALDRTLAHALRAPSALAQPASAFHKRP